LKPSHRTLEGRPEEDQGNATEVSGNDLGNNKKLKEIRQNS
jgi:hypothetical protein